MTTCKEKSDLPRFWALYADIVGDGKTSPRTKQNRKIDNRKRKGGENNGKKTELSCTESKRAAT